LGKERILKKRNLGEKREGRETPCEKESQPVERRKTKTFMGKE